MVRSASAVLRRLPSMSTLQQPGWSNPLIIFKVQPGRQQLVILTRFAGLLELEGEPLIGAARVAAALNSALARWRARGFFVARPR